MVFGHFTTLYINISSKNKNLNDFYIPDRPDPQDDQRLPSLGRPMRTKQMSRHGDIVSNCLVNDMLTATYNYDCQRLRTEKESTPTIRVSIELIDLPDHVVHCICLQS